MASPDATEPSLAAVAVPATAVVEPRTDALRSLVSALLEGRQLQPQSRKQHPLRAPPPPPPPPLPSSLCRPPPPPPPPMSSSSSAPSSAHTVPPPPDSAPFSRRLVDKAELRKGLACLSAVLCGAVAQLEKAVAEEEEGNGSEDMEIELEFSLAACEAVIVACYDLPAEEGMTEEVETVFLLALQLCLLALEKASRQLSVQGYSKYSYEQLFKKLMMILELVLVEDNARDRGSLYLNLADKMVPEKVPTIDVDSSYDFGSKCCKKGPGCDRRIMEISGDIIPLLAGGQSVKDDSSLSISKFQTVKHNSDMLSLAKHFAVLHLRLHSRLLAVCKNILVCCKNISVGDKDAEAVFQNLTKFVTRILKLLTSMYSLLSYCASLDEVVNSLVEVEAVLAGLLEIACAMKLDVGEGETTQECSIMGLLKSFLRLAEAVIPDDSLFLNMRAYLAVIILQSLSSRKTGKEEVGGSVSVLEPQLVPFLLEVVNEIHAHRWKRDHAHSSTAMPPAAESGNRSRFQLVLPDSQVFALLEPRSQEELMQIVFPYNGAWLDKLISVLYLYHAEVMELRPKIETMTILRNANRDACLNQSPDRLSTSSEEEALFGNLFAETCKLSANSDIGSAQASALERGLNVSYNAFLQAVFDVLGFLNVCVFSMSWQKNVFEAACKLLNEQHVNTLLQIFFSGLDFHIIGAENRDHIASQSSSDMLILTDKANFDLLLSLVDKHVLTEALEGYAISQILEKGYYICSLGQRSLVLIVKILIQRSIIGQEKLDDPLKVDLWKSFLKKVTERARDLSWVCSLNEAAAGLTSVLHMEVLLMTYHSVSSSQRSLIVQSLVTALKEVCGVSGELNETQFAVWSLICSRLVMAIHYTATHSETFPAWLLSHLRTKFQGHSQEDYFSSDIEENSLLSWAAIVGKKESVEEEHSDSSYLQQLFDVNDFSLRGTLDGAKLLTHAHLEDFLGSALALIDKWTSRSARRVEEFIVERYMFFIVWIAVRECGSGVLPENPSFTSSVFFMQFTQCLYAFEDGKSDQISKQWLWFFKNAFSAIENISSAEISADLTTWHFLRRGSSISLLLLFLQQGLSKVTDVKANDSSVQKSSSPKDVQIQVLSEQLAVDLLCEESSSFDEALKAVFSILSLYMSALRKCILNAYAEQHLLQETVDSMELLLQVGVSHGELEQLFLKMGVDFQLLERLLRWGDSTSLWQSEILAKIPGIQFGSGFLDRMCFSALLHGYPSCTNLASAAVMSCLMVLETVLGTLGLLLRAHGSIKKSHEGWEQSQICQDLLSIVLNIISDGMLHVIHPKCQEALDLLLPSKEEQLKHSNLASLKRTESLLVSVCSKKELCGAVREELILQAVENVNVIQADRLKADVMQEYFISGGCLSAFVDVLDVCSNKTVNAKVFQLLMDLTGGETAAQNFPSVELQEKFVTTDTAALSYWLEKRLLGGVEGSSPESIASAATRDMAMMFLTSLVSSSSSSLSGKDLRSHLVDALIIGLERAFCFFEVNAARAYFGFLVQLASTPDLIERVLQSVVELVGKLANQSTCLEGIKSFLAYLNRIVNQSSMQRQQLWYKSAESKHLPVGAGRSQQVSVAKKNSELLHAAIDQSEQQQSGTVPAADCDAISVDEDEDEGTSDGEVTCFEKDEDAGSEKGASGVCTFTSSGSNFMEQHWYFCYTCDLTMSKGCCSICARICHRGHKVVYSRLSRFFCDCGAGGVRGSACLCLKPRKHASPRSTVSSIGASTNDSFLPLPDNQDRLSSSDSDLDGEDDLLAENERASKLCLSEDEGKQLLQLLLNLDIEAQILSLCQKLIQGPDFNTLSELCPNVEVDLSQDKSLAFRHEFLQLKRLFKSGSFDIKIKAEYPNSRELKSHLMSGSIVKSLLSVSSRGRLAAGEGDKVSIFDVCQVIGQPGAGSGPVITVDKANVKPLSKNAVRFEIVHLAFNSLNEGYLAVAGYEDCQVFTINPRGEVSDRLALELALQDAYIRQIAWVPRSQVQLMVVTNKFVKIYDLSQDNLCPVHYFTALDDDIADATLVPIGHEQLRLLVLSVQGTLCTQQIIAGKDPGACILTDTLKLPDKFGLTKGVSIHFSAAHRLLFLSYSNGLSLVGHLNKEATELTQVSSLLEAEQDGKAKVAGLHHWRETFENSRLFVGLCTLKANSVVAVHMGSSEPQAQNLRMSGSSGMPRVDGIVAYRPSTKENNYLLMLHDDGSLQVFSFSLTGEDLSSSSGNADNAKQTSSEEKAKKLSAALLGSRINSSPNPVFPLDFFEKTTCITQEVRLGGDILRNNDSEIAKQNLALDDAFVEGPSPTGFKIVVYNSNPDIVMVGCRVHVGNTASSHIPCELCLFQRVIKLEEGVRCWYDIPFTNAEALVADEEFTLTVGPTFNGSSLPRIDTLEVYGRSKDDFGWKEKLDAILNLDSQTATSSSSGCRSKQLRNVYKASVQEQIIADGLKLLCGYYLACRFQLSPESTDESLDSSRERCQPLMELIFGSDRHLLLQLSARRVLRALYPVKDAYYQAVDSLRLMGILRIIPILESKIGYGGYVTSWAIQEFASLMCSVCKILLHRKANLASFLESNGSSVIDGLMGLLWEILCIEQPDNQTINSLVIPAVDLIYGYAECLVLNGGNDAMLTGITVAPAVVFFRKLLFAPYEAVQASCSLAMSSRLLQVPFPKQTIVAIDDAGESSRANPIASDSGVTNGASGQVMMEEDGATDSVQYCCDGCSTVPIVGRRWHCTICPDFDLCETCYEILDSDRLPPPHSREHLMTAISIEVDVVGAEGSDVHFPSIDDMGGGASGDALLQAAAELNLEPASSGDPNSCRDYSEISSIETKAATMSASTKALNSLILCRLTEEIKGWMRSFPGTRVIPLLQLFYKLASAPSGPFTEPTTSEGLDLEKFVKALLEEMVLSVPLSTKSRTSFGETIILLFSFFNLVLRNWHQPGSDHSQLKPGPGIVDSNVHGISLDSLEKSKNFSQIERAWSSLRQQQLLNYIFAIIQQLSHLFKSSSHSQDSAGPSCPSNVACGALLTVRKEFATGSFAPYFSDSYAKAHRGDLFGSYHRLLLESAFRLAYSLVRPEKPEKLSDKEQMSYKSGGGVDLKLDGWQEVLCSYINNPYTTSIRRFARRLLLHICGSKGHYYNIRDAWQLSREVKKIYKLVQKSGFQSLNSYEKRVKLVKSLSVVLDVAVARPRNWQKYCLRHTDILQFFLNGIFSFAEESVVLTLKLLTLAFYTGKELGPSFAKADQSEAKPSLNSQASSKTPSQSSEGRKKRRGAGEDLNDGVLDKAFLDMEVAVDLFAAEEGKLMKRFIDAYLLEWNAASVRSEAKDVLYGAWHHGRHAVRALVLTLLLQRVPLLPSYGQNVAEYTDLLTWLLGKGISDSEEMTSVHSCLTGDVVKGIFNTLRSQNQLLANHPNSRIYNTLSSLVEFDGFYLESDPCLACSFPEVPYTKMKLESLKSETKFTDNRILVKCVGSHTIQSVTMNVHDVRRSKSVKVLNLYYNNRTVADLSELKNNWSLWKKAKSCHLTFNQTELKVEFPIPITACNFMIELDSFYENLQAASLESLQCPRCSRYVTDKHGICSNCHENAYQCRQCRNINYENLDSFLCNECGYSKYGRFEFNFVARPSFHYDGMENDEDMKKVLAAIETESENAHRKYQQLVGFKKPLLKLVSSIGEAEMDSQQKDSMQQMIVSLPGSSSFKINRKIAILGVLYGEKCKMAFDSLSRSVQTLQGLRRILTAYLEQKRSTGSASADEKLLRPNNRCYGCANTFVGHCLDWLQVLAKIPHCKQQLVSLGILSELFENNIHQGAKSVRLQARSALCTLTDGDAVAVSELNNLIKQKAVYCLEHHRSIDVAASVREELQLLSETCALADDVWEARLKVVFQLLFSSIKAGARHPAIAEYIILPCLKIISNACTPPKSESVNEPSVVNVASSALPQNVLRPEESSRSSLNPPQKSNEHSQTEKDTHWETRGQDMPLVNYVEWKNGSTYVDFIRRQYTVSQIAKPLVQKPRRDQRRTDYLALKYILRWKRRACKMSVTNELAAFEEVSWVSELALSACSPAIRLEMCGLIGMLCSQSPTRRSKFLNLLMSLLPSTPEAGENAAEYFDLLFKMIESEDARLYLTVRGVLPSLCSLITEEVHHIEAQEHSFHTDISQGYILHKFIELLAKLLQVSNIRARFVKEDLLEQVLEALLVIKSLVVQKTKLIGDCGRLLRELLDSLLIESDENKKHFIRACIRGLQVHAKNKKNRTFLFILEQLCDIICPTKPEPVYMMVLNKARTQEEYIRGSMTKNPYASSEIGALMRDVKNKICQQLDLLGLLEDDYGMELLVAGNIISLDLSIAQVYEQVWRKSQSQGSGSTTGGKECPPMAITYRLQGLEGEATEPMIKELEDNREESQDPEVEFAIAGVMWEYGGLEIILGMIQMLKDEELKLNPEELYLVLKLLVYCCKIRDNRRALLRLGALGVFLDTAHRAFSAEAVELAERLLLLVESLATEANESDISVVESLPRAGEQAANAMLMFLERLSHPYGVTKSAGKQQRNNDMIARILPYLTYGEQAAMEMLVSHFYPYLQDWLGFDELQKKHLENPKEESLAQQAAQHMLAAQNFVKVAESIKNDSYGERLKDLILKKEIPAVALRYLKVTFQVFEEGSQFKSTSEWVQGLESQAVPMILSMLRGLCKGHYLTQKCLEEEGVLPLLHALEGVSSDNEIGVRAENLMDMLANKDGKEGYLAEKVINLRHATRDEMRRRALRKREELLQGLGMRRELTVDGGERIVVSKPFEGIYDIEEEEESGLACMVCREGYSLRPADMLGTYCYCKYVNLGVGTTSQVRTEGVYTTVSHFNIIHFQCHQEAKRADSSLKNPKKEWEGATLRNNETLCNNLFPLRGPSVPLSQYIRCVDQYWDNLNTLGRADGSRFRLLSYDIVLMLARFATGASFSTDSKGGGKESNSQLLPFMLQMGWHLLEQAGASQRRSLAKALSTYLISPTSEESSAGSGSKLSSSPAALQRVGAVDETVQFMMVQSLFLESFDHWQRHRRIFLRHGIYHAYMQYKHGQSALPASSLPPLDSSVSESITNSEMPLLDKCTESSLLISNMSHDQLFTMVKPMLVYTGLVDRLQRCFKLAITNQRNAEGSSGRIQEGGENSEPWEADMKEKLRDIRVMLGFSNEFLDWLEVMQDVNDLQGAFSKLDVLGDVLSGGFKSCDEFVWDAINSAANR